MENKKCKCYQLPYHDKFMEECKCDCHQSKTTSITPENEKLSTLPEGELCDCLNHHQRVDWGKENCACPCHTEPQEVAECKECQFENGEHSFECSKYKDKFEEVADWEKTIIPEYSNIAVLNEDCVDGYEMVKAVPFITKTLEQERAKWRNELINLIKISETNNEFLDNLDKLLTKLKSN
jgi:hypothetical protein